MNANTAPRNETTRSKKVLVPLATLLAAGAIAIGSGATFTSQSESGVSSVTSGTLSHTNSKADAAIFQLEDIKPGDTLHGDLTLTNTGSLDAKFNLTEKSSANAFSDDLLTLTITNTTTGTPVFDGTFGDLVDGEKQALGQIDAGEANTFRFTVSLDQDAGNDEQGKTASATYTWDSVQLDGETATQ